MKLRNFLVTLIFFGTIVASGVASGKAQTFSSSKSIEPTITAKVTSNRFNIYEGDIEEINLTPNDPTEVLIGMVGDSSGTVFVEVNNCESGKVYTLFKRKINLNTAVGEVQEVNQTDCQVGLAFLYYDLKLEDLGQTGESVDFLISSDAANTTALANVTASAGAAKTADIEAGTVSIADIAGKPVVKLGTVIPRVEIAAWESYLFIDELFSYSSQSEMQMHIGADNVYLTLVTAFSGVFNGQLVDFEYSHQKNGQTYKQTQQFILEDSVHEIDFTRTQHNLDVGDIIELKYKIAGYEKSYRFQIQRHYQQHVRIKDARVVYDLVLDNVDWYQNEELECLNFDCDFSRGGKEIEVSHSLISPVGSYYLGNYQLHFSLDGYQHLYLNTSLVLR